MKINSIDISLKAQYGEVKEERYQGLDSLHPIDMLHTGGRADEQL
jgi:hypothetical protein